MDNLKIVLLIVGSILVIGILVDAVRRIKAFAKWSHDLENQAMDDIVLEEEVEPTISQQTEPMMTHSIAEDNQDFDSRVIEYKEVPTVPGYEEQAVVFLLQTGVTQIPGYDLRNTLEDMGCILKDGIFEHPAFKVANASSEGLFRVEQLAAENFAAIVIYFEFAKKELPVESFDEMLRMAKLLATRWQADIKDHQGRTLVDEKIYQLRDKVKAYQQKLSELLVGDQNRF